MMTSLYSASAIDERVKDIAEDINKEFAGQDSIHAVVTLNGAFVFAADLIRHLKVPLVMHFAGATSFGKNNVNRCIGSLQLRGRCKQQKDKDQPP